MKKTLVLLTAGFILIASTAFGQQPNPQNPLGAKRRPASMIPTETRPQAGTPAPAGAMTASLAVAGGDSCPLPVAPEIELIAMSDDGQPMNISVIVYQLAKDEYGTVQAYWIAQSQCSPSDYGPVTGCFEGGRTRIKVDSWGSLIGAGDYMILGSFQGYYPTVTYLSATSGNVATANILMRRMGASITVVGQPTARAGLLTIDFSINGSVPAGTEVYVIAKTYQPDWSLVEWESSRKPVTAGEYPFGSQMKEKIFDPNAMAVISICADIYLVQRGNPSRPLAVLQWVCAANQK